jgi:hypothetical protein
MSDRCTAITPADRNGEISAPLSRIVFLNAVLKQLT